VSSGGAATGSDAAPAAGAARRGVADLARKNGHQPFHLFRPALLAGNGHLFVTAPEEELEALPAFPASEFKNRHRFIS
jgi:hypothetical protein